MWVEEDTPITPYSIARGDDGMHLPRTLIAMIPHCGVTVVSWVLPVIPGLGDLTAWGRSTDTKIHWTEECVRLQHTSQVPGQIPGPSPNPPKFTPVELDSQSSHQSNWTKDNSWFIWVHEEDIHEQITYIPWCGGTSFCGQTRYTRPQICHGGPFFHQLNSWKCHVYHRNDVHAFWSAIK